MVKKLEDQLTLIGRQIVIYFTNVCERQKSKFVPQSHRRAKGAESQNLWSIPPDKTGQFIFSIVP